MNDFVDMITSSTGLTFLAGVITGIMGMLLLSGICAGVQRDSDG